MPPETTALSPEQEKQFQAWAAANKITDVDHPDSHYDYRGFWLASGGTPVQFGVDHFPDTFKQHGHPTFSVESKYSAGPTDGGHWDGEKFMAQDPTPTPTSPVHDAKWLANYNAAKQSRQDLTPEAYDSGLALGGTGTITPVNQYKVDLLRDATATLGPAVANQLLKILAPQLAVMNLADKTQQAAMIDNFQAQNGATAYIPQAQEADRQVRHAAFRQYWQQTYALPLVQGQGPTAAGQAATTNQSLSEQESVYEGKYDTWYDSNAGWTNPADTGFANFFVSQAQATGVIGDARPDLDPSSPYYQSAKGVIQQQVNVTVQVAQQRAAQVKAVQAAVTRATSNLLTLRNSLAGDPEIADTNALSAAFDDLTDPYLAQGYQAALALNPALTADQYIGGAVGPHIQQQLSTSGGRYAAVTDALGGVDLAQTAAGVKTVQVQQTKDDAAKQKDDIGKTTFQANVDNLERNMTPEQKAQINPDAFLKAATVNGVVDYAAATKNLTTAADAIATGAANITGYGKAIAPMTAATDASGQATAHGFGAVPADVAAHLRGNLTQADAQAIAQSHSLYQTAFSGQDREGNDGPQAGQALTAKVWADPANIDPVTGKPDLAKVTAALHKGIIQAAGDNSRINPAMGGGWRDAYDEYHQMQLDAAPNVAHDAQGHAILPADDQGALARAKSAGQQAPAPAKQTATVV